MIQPISGNIGCGNQFSFTTYCSTPLANLSNAFCRCWTCTCCFPTFHENMCKLWFQFWWEASSSEVLIRMRWVRQEAAQIHMAVCSLGWDSVAPLAVIQVNRISDGYSGGSLRHLPLANHCPQTVWPGTVVLCMLTAFARFQRVHAQMLSIWSELFVLRSSPATVHKQSLHPPTALIHWQRPAPACFGILKFALRHDTLFIFTIGRWLLTPQSQRIARLWAVLENNQKPRQDPRCKLSNPIYLSITPRSYKVEPPQLHHRFFPHSSQVWAPHQWYVGSSNTLRTATPNDSNHHLMSSQATKFGRRFKKRHQRK